jgi:hypothetical protein
MKQSKYYFDSEEMKLIYKYTNFVECGAVDEVSPMIK